MTTLIAVYNSDGCVGRCDAKCYNATNPECDCICGGKNHGAGKQQAIENTRELAENWLQTYAERHHLDSWYATILARLPQQLSLFELDELETDG